MKTLLTFALALICLLHHISEADSDDIIPRSKIKFVERNYNICPRNSITVTTVCDEQICMNYSLIWSQKLLADFKKSIANNMSPSARFNTSPCRNKSSKVKISSL